MQNTHRKSDLNYLEEILASSPRYKKIDVTKEGAAGLAGYGNAWGHLEPRKLYVKIDDDVVCNGSLPDYSEFKMEFLIREPHRYGLPMMLSHAS